MEQGQEYPESWDEGSQAYSATDKDLKLKAGDKVRVKFISGPLTYRETYVELGETKEDGTAKKTRIALPTGSQLAGYDTKVRHLCEVVVLDGPAKGEHKLFAFGKQIYDQLVGIKEDWGSTRRPDITLKRTGSTKNDTKYTASGVESTVDAKEYTPKFDLVKEARFSKKEDLDKLPPPVTARVSEDVTAKKASQAQLDMIDKLCADKEMKLKDLNKVIERQFEKLVPVNDLTMGQASKLIEALS